MKPIIVIAGPTASGKSVLAKNLAEKINAYIINGDSRQLYQEIQIATAKPTTKEFRGIKTYMYDFVPLEQRYSLWDYQKDVKRILIKEKGNQAIIVGGTGLYIDSVIFNYELPKISRKNFDKDISGLNDSDRKNPRRLNSLYSRASLPNKGKAFDHIYFVLDIEKNLLNMRIEKRVDYMLKKGLEEESRLLFEKYHNQNLPSLKTVGYQEFEEYFLGKKTIEKVREEIIFHTRQYAKRQRTWFRRNKEAIYIKNISQAMSVLKEKGIT